MTISSNVSRMNYTGNGSVATYSFSFKIFNDEDLLVTTRNTSNVETTLVLTTDYTVSGAGDDSGGSITLVAGNLTSGYALTIRRVVDIVQATRLRNQGSFYPESHEDAFDYMTMISQQLQDGLDHSIQTAETDTGVGLTLPSASERASKFFAFDSDGNAIAASSSTAGALTVSSYIQTLLDDSTAAIARATLGFSGTAGTVAAAQLASDSVITAKILDANVTRAKLAAGAVGNGAVTATKTTTYTAVSTTDDFIPCDASSAGFTVNLPAVASNTGKRFWIQKIDSSNNVVTVDGNASETINGATTIKLSTQYESVQLYCTGSVWIIVSRDYPKTTLSSLTYTFDNAGTTTSVDCRSQRIGDRLFVQGEGLVGVVVGSAFAINMPTGLTIDTAKISSSTSAQVVGVLHRLAATAQTYPGSSYGPYPVFYDGSTSGKLFVAQGSGGAAYQLTKATGTSLFANSDGFTFSMNVPVTNWE